MTDVPSRRSTPTEKQYDRLRAVGNGCVVVTPGRRDWEPLLRRGWVQPAWGSDDSSRFLPPLQITPTGLHALADAVERYGLPSPRREDTVVARRVCADCGSARYRFKDATVDEVRAA